MKWLWRSLSILAVATILAGFGGYFWLKNYLHSEDFRIFMGETVSSTIDADASFGPFEWQGMQARTPNFQANGDGFLRGIKADGIRAKVGMGEFSEKTWEISGVQVSRLDIHLDSRSTSPAPTSTTPAGDEPESEARSNDGGGFLAGFLPDKAKLIGADVSSLNLNLKTDGGHLQIDDTVAIIESSPAVHGAYDIKLSQGRIDTAWFPVPLDLRTARLRYSTGKVFLQASEAKVYERGQLTLSGEVGDGNYGFQGVLQNVRSEELVPESWQKRITGDLATRFKVQSHRDGNIIRGKLRLSNGVLTALPLLDRIAAYSNTRRFRRLDLSEATLNYRKQGEVLELTEIVIASEGLVRIVGDLTINGKQLDGRFKVGITPGTLSHIPGAETKVFLRGENGLLWSPLRITGTIDSPKEDLSGRMIAAAGERMFEMVPETGKMALKFAHDTATQLPSKATETGSEVLEQGTDIIRDGTRGILDLIPVP